jgi:hypothetical protein
MSNNESLGTIHSGEFKFDFWWEQFLVRLYLPRARILKYRGPFPLGNFFLKKAKLNWIHLTKKIPCITNLIDCIIFYGLR